jgi:hypothetical protein
MKEIYLMFITQLPLSLELNLSFHALGLSLQGESLGFINIGSRTLSVKA